METAAENPSVNENIVASSPELHLSPEQKETKENNIKKLKEISTGVVNLISDENPEKRADIQRKLSEKRYNADTINTIFAVAAHSASQSETTTDGMVDVKINGGSDVQKRGIDVGAFIQILKAEKSLLFEKLKSGVDIEERNKILEEKKELQEKIKFLAGDNETEGHSVNYHREFTENVGEVQHPVTESEANIIAGEESIVTISVNGKEISYFSRGKGDIDANYAEAMQRYDGNSVKFKADSSDQLAVEGNLSPIYPILFKAEEDKKTEIIPQYVKDSEGNTVAGTALDIVRGDVYGPFNIPAIKPETVVIDLAEALVVNQPETADDVEPVVDLPKTTIELDAGDVGEYIHAKAKETALKYIQRNYEWISKLPVGKLGKAILNPIFRGVSSLSGHREFEYIRSYTKIRESLTRSASESVLVGKEWDTKAPNALGYSNAEALAKVYKGEHLDYADLESRGILRPDEAEKLRLEVESVNYLNKQGLSEYVSPEKFRQAVQKEAYNEELREVNPLVSPSSVKGIINIGLNDPQIAAFFKEAVSDASDKMKFEQLVDSLQNKAKGESQSQGLSELIPTGILSTESLEALRSLVLQYESQKDQLDSFIDNANIALSILNVSSEFKGDMSRDKSMFNVRDETLRKIYDLKSSGKSGSYRVAAGSAIAGVVVATNLVRNLPKAATVVVGPAAILFGTAYSFVKAENSSSGSVDNLLRKFIETEEEAKTNKGKLGRFFNGADRKQFELASFNNLYKGEYSGRASDLLASLSSLDNDEQKTALISVLARRNVNDLDLTDSKGRKISLNMIAGSQKDQVELFKKANDILKSLPNDELAELYKEVTYQSLILKDKALKFDAHKKILAREDGAKAGAIAMTLGMASFINNTLNSNELHQIGQKSVDVQVSKPSVVSSNPSGLPKFGKPEVASLNVTDKSLEIPSNPVAEMNSVSISELHTETPATIQHFDSIDGSDGIDVKVPDGIIAKVVDSPAGKQVIFSDESNASVVLSVANGHVDYTNGLQFLKNHGVSITEKAPIITETQVSLDTANNEALEKLGVNIVDPKNAYDGSTALDQAGRKISNRWNFGIQTAKIVDGAGNMIHNYADGTKLVPVGADQSLQMNFTSDFKSFLEKGGVWKDGTQYAALAKMYGGQPIPNEDLRIWIAFDTKDVTGKTVHELAFIKPTSDLVKIDPATGNVSIDGSVVGGSTFRAGVGVMKNTAAGNEFVTLNSIQTQPIGAGAPQISVKTEMKDYDFYSDSVTQVKTEIPAPTPIVSPVAPIEQPAPTVEITPPVVEQPQITTETELWTYFEKEMRLGAAVAYNTTYSTDTYGNKKGANNPNGNLNPQQSNPISPIIPPAFGTATTGAAQRAIPPASPMPVTSPQLTQENEVEPEVTQTPVGNGIQIPAYQDFLKQADIAAQTPRVSPPQFGNNNEVETRLTDISQGEGPRLLPAGNAPEMKLLPAGEVDLSSKEPILLGAEGETQSEKETSTNYFPIDSMGSPIQYRPRSEFETAVSNSLGENFSNPIELLKYASGLVTEPDPAHDHTFERGAREIVTLERVLNLTENNADFWTDIQRNPASTQYNDLRYRSREEVLSRLAQDNQALFEGSGSNTRKNEAVKYYRELISTSEADSPYRIQAEIQINELTNPQPRVLITPTPGTNLESAGANQSQSEEKIGYTDQQKEFVNNIVQEFHNYNKEIAETGPKNSAEWELAGSLMSGKNKEISIFSFSEALKDPDISDEKKLDLRNQISQMYLQIGDINSAINILSQNNPRSVSEILSVSEEARKNNEEFIRPSNSFTAKESHELYSRLLLDLLLKEKDNSGEDLKSVYALSVGTKKEDTLNVLADIRQRMVQVRAGSLAYNAIPKDINEPMWDKIRNYGFLPNDKHAKFLTEEAGRAYEPYEKQGPIQPKKEAPAKIIDPGNIEVKPRDESTTSPELLNAESKVYEIVENMIKSGSESAEPYRNARRVLSEGRYNDLRRVDYVLAQNRITEDLEKIIKEMIHDRLESNSILILGATESNKGTSGYEDFRESALALRNLINEGVDKYNKESSEKKDIPVDSGGNNTESKGPIVEASGNTNIKPETSEYKEIEIKNKELFLNVQKLMDEVALLPERKDYESIKDEVLKRKYYLKNLTQRAENSLQTQPGIPENRKLPKKGEFVYADDIIKNIFAILENGNNGFDNTVLSVYDYEKIAKDVLGIDLYEEDRQSGNTNGFSIYESAFGDLYSAIKTAKEIINMPEKNNSVNVPQQVAVSSQIPTEASGKSLDNPPAGLNFDEGIDNRDIHTRIADALKDHKEEEIDVTDIETKLIDEMNKTPKISENNQDFATQLINEANRINGVVQEAAGANPEDLEDTIKIEYQLVSNEEANNVLNQLEVHGNPFNGKILNKNILSQEGMQPKYKRIIDGKSVYISDPFSVDDQDRVGYIAYLEDENGKQVPRTFYFSNSQGTGRLLRQYDFKRDPVTGIQKVMWYGKGYNEESIFLPLEIQKTIADISLHTSPKKVSDENRDLLFVGTTRGVGANDSFLANVDRNSIQLEGNFYPNYKREKIHPQDLNFGNPSTYPNFSKGIIDTWKFSSSVYPDLTARVVESNDGIFRYLFLTDDQGRTMIGGIDNNSKLTPNGVRERWISAGNLTTPIWEYKVPDADQTGGFGDDSNRNGPYVDMYKNYLSKIPVIREFEQKILNQSK